MKSTFILLITCLICFKINSQIMTLDPSLEIHDTDGCDANNTSSQFNDHYTYVHAFADDAEGGPSNGAHDIYKNTNCVPLDPPDGATHIALVHTEGLRESLAFDLTTPIVAGSEYSISLWASPITLPSNSYLDDGRVMIGISNSLEDFGAFAWTTPTMEVDQGYAYHEGTFIASMDATYLTLRPNHNYDDTWETYMLIDNIELVNLTPPALEINTTVLANVSCADGSDGSAQVSITSGTEPFELTWSNGQASEIATMLPAGIYSVTVTDAAGMEEIATVEIADGIQVEVFSTEIIDPSCFGYQDGSATVSSENGIDPITYIWSNGDEGSTISQVTSGPYTATATDLNGCTGEIEIVIEQPEEILISAEITDDTCLDDSMGSIILTAQGGNPPFDYLWEDGSQSNSRTDLASGIYQTTITDANFCGIVVSNEVGSPNNIDLSIVTVINPACFGESSGSIALTPIGGNSNYSFDWSNGMTTSTISDISVGDYSVTVTDSNDCSASAEYTLTSPEEILLSTTSTSESGPGAEDGSASVSVNSGGESPFTYLWSNGETTPMINGLSQGLYEVTVTDNNGCTNTDFANVSSSDCEFMATVVVEGVNCFGGNDGSASISVSNENPPVSYFWSDGSIEGDRSDLSSGVFSITIVDNSGCSDTINDILIPEPLELMVSINVISPGSCDTGGALEAIAVGGTPDYEFEWSNGETTITIDSLPENDYFITVTDANGCTAFQEASITPIDTTSPNLILQDMFLYATQTGFDNIEASDFDNGSTDNCGQINFSFQSTPMIGCEFIGTQTVTIIGHDESNNSSMDQVTLTLVDTLPPVLSNLYDTIIVESCEPIEFDLPMAMDNCGDSIIITQKMGYASGQVFPVGLTEQSFEFNDLSGNKTEFNFIIEVVSDLMMDVFVTDTDCFGDSTGLVLVQLSGTHAPYLQDSSLIQNELPAGTYTINAFDTIGCIATSEIVINEPDELATTTQTKPASTSTANDGEITIEVSGGTQPYTIRLFDSDGNDLGTSESGIFPNLFAGTYSCLIMDDNGCNVSFGNIIVDINVSTFDLFDTQKINVYPNPVQDQLSVAVSKLDKSIIIELHSVHGVELFKTIVDKKGVVVLDMTKFNSGLYFLSVTAQNARSSKRIIVTD